MLPNTNFMEIIDTGYLKSWVLMLLKLDVFMKISENGTTGTES